MPAQHERAGLEGHCVIPQQHLWDMLHSSLAPVWGCLHLPALRRQHLCRTRLHCLASTALPAPVGTCMHCFVSTAWDCLHCFASTCGASPALLCQHCFATTVWDLPALLHQHCVASTCGDLPALLRQHCDHFVLSSTARHQHHHILRQSTTLFSPPPTPPTISTPPHPQHYQYTPATARFHRYLGLVVDRVSEVRMLPLPDCLVCLHVCLSLCFGGLSVWQSEDVCLSVHQRTNAMMEVESITVICW
jgi:hypothetical protein